MSSPLSRPCRTVSAADETSVPAPLLPIGALLLAASCNGLAQTPPAASSEATRALREMVVRESPEAGQGKHSIRPTTTTVGKGKQDIRDIPQSVTVFTERLMDDRNLDDFREVLRTTAGVTFQAGETGEEDVRLRGFSLRPGRRHLHRRHEATPPLYERDTFNHDRVEVLKGSASMLFGKGSTGGVVNQVNKTAVPDGPARGRLHPRHRPACTASPATSTSRPARTPPLRLNAMVHDADNCGAKQRQAGIAPTFRWGIGTRDEFSVGLYYLDIEGRPDYNHPWLLSNGNQGALIPSLPAQNFYGLASDHLNTRRPTRTLGHIHRFDDEGELKTRLRHGQLRARPAGQRDPLRSPAPRMTNLDAIHRRSPARPRAASARAT